MNDIVVTGESRDDMLMVKVIESGNVEALEKFLALREREEARLAAREFDAHFSEMQSEFGTVSRTKKGYGYSYAPLEELQLTYMPIVSRHGFSCAWSETATEHGKRCTMRISGHGSFRDNSIDIPQLEPSRNRDGKAQMNAVQVAGAMSTYGRRYTFISGFGVIIADEDHDGVPQATAEDYAQDVGKLNDAKDLESLAKAWTPIFTAYRGDKSALAVLTAVKDKKKAELNG